MGGYASWFMGRLRPPALFGVKHHSRIAPFRNNQLTHGERTPNMTTGTYA